MTNSSPSRHFWPAFAPVLILFAITCFLFARVQNLWIDETTQLSGSTLGLSDLLTWLSGKTPDLFGVPADRMPPFSYLVDRIGWLIWGNNLLAFRLYHTAIVGVGVTVLTAVLARRVGLPAALVAALFLVLPPKLTTIAIEIRAYPILFTLSCLQLALVIRGDVAARTGRLALFLLLGLLGGYTHFFGIIGSCALFVAVFIDAPDLRSAIRAVIGQLLLFLGWSGLAPFVFGATSISNTALEPVGAGIGAIVTFGLQLLGSSSQLVDLPGAALFFAGVGLLLLLMLGLVVLRVKARGLDGRHDLAVQLLLALGAGLSVTLVAAVLVKGFNPLSPTYNLWSLPIIAVLLGLTAQSLLSSTKAARAAGLLGLAMLAIGSAWGQAGLLLRAPWFIHGPSTTLEAMIDRAGPDPVVLYVGPSWSWGYFPLYWRHGDTLPQWLLSPDGTSAVPIARGGDVRGAPRPLSELAAHRALIVARIETRSYRDIPALAAAPAPVYISPDLSLSLSAQGWQAGDIVFTPGFYTLTGEYYRKRSQR